MGWISDTFRVLLGFDQEERTYQDSLANAERYAGWGRSGGGARDLERALELLADCPTGAAPNAHYLYRRDRVGAEAHFELARLAVQGLRAQAGKLQEHFEGIEEGRRNTLAQLEVLRKRVAQLEAEGSLISAREERLRLEEMEREVRERPDLKGDRLAQKAGIFAASTPGFRSHREGAARHLRALRALEGLGKEDHTYLDSACAKVEKALAELDAEWKRLGAEFQPAARAPRKKAEPER